MYGKIKNGALVPAPKTLVAFGKVSYNPDEALYREMGYLPVVNTPYPQDGKAYTESWEEKDGEIVCVWAESESEDPKGMTAEERLCQAESELATLRASNEQLNAEVMYLCMMNGIEPTEVNA